MTTHMNRLQVSLREEQAAYLARRAERDGVSMAEVVRRMVDAEAAAEQPTEVDAAWDIVGLIDEELPLIDGVPVSENPDLYLYGRPGAATERKRKRGQA